MLMVAIYSLWHRVLAPSDHRPDAARVLAKHENLLRQVEVPAFVVGLLSGQMPEWTEDQWHRLATDRRTARLKRRHLELPAGFDAALQVMAAQRLTDAGRAEEARTLARFAVEELPGNERLIAWEAGLATGHASELDLRALVLGLEPGAESQEQQPHSRGEPTAASELDASPTGDEPRAEDNDAVDDRANADAEAHFGDEQPATSEHDPADAESASSD